MSIRVNVKDFSTTPGPRFESQGPDSAERFVRDYLFKSIKMAFERNEKVIVHLDGVEGYDVSFLEETFGGLFRIETYKKLELKLPLGQNLDKTWFDWLNKHLSAYSVEFLTYLNIAKKYQKNAMERI